ncbi:mannitol dehydrogenase family protein [Hoeflea ulvae]|uniref:Mannitol dehydrogenase family protein n=1 Tax=Hoeflea ulvae TaxID=2983764 RepID=A0ABT3YK99_9HYPH|nr:mannitol dehydrogenase family protein [Hoeflea ulvae]MCY0096320.1 mannitol dehydrogenase family protein [Hoeflea ulvae]
MPAEMERLGRSKDRPKPKSGIVHLGLGAFFRAFGAIYIDDAVRVSGGDWGIVGVSLQSPGTRDKLAPQDFVYTTVSQDPDGGETFRRIEILETVLVAPEDPDAVLARMTDPAIRIVTLTVTEKGYCHDPASGRLNFSHPDIEHDLTHAKPRTAIGYLVRALQRRRDAGDPPFTVLTCDNLPENGKLVRGVVLDFARALDPELAGWIETEGRFPSTMVDRITPATKPEDVERLAQKIGIRDEAPVLCEPFRQWVVEDDFVPAYDGAEAYPDLAAAGVEMVADVTPFEHMKLRMLNGTHSSLAYLGYLAGHETIAETVADPVFAGFAKRLWQEEIMPSFSPPEGVNLADYADALFKRYSNPAIRHRTWQIAMDGSQKLPQRILGTIADNLAAGRASPGLMLAVAAWMRYVGGVDEKGQSIEVKDPLAGRLRGLSDAAETPAEKVAALLSVREIFSAELAAQLLEPVTHAYQELCRLGARRAAEDIT